MQDLLFEQDEATGVWDIPFGDLTEPAIVEDRAAVGQHIRHRLRTFLGEWVLDTSVGVPYFQEIFVKGVPLSTVQALLKRAIVRSPKVTQLLGFALDYDNATREARVEFVADTEYGRLLERIGL
jgi:hypothetical protein